MSDLLLKAGSIALLLGGLIFVHELGHFLVAKLLRVKVVRFSIGFGPKIFAFQRGETEYRIAALPLGGYVKMAGDEPGEEPAPEDRGRGFLEQPPWKRFAIAFAGPAMNLLFPGVIYIAMTLAQNGELVPGPRVGSVSPGSPAATAGLQPGDRILSVTTPDGRTRPVRHFNDLREIVSPHPGEALRLDIERGATRLPPLTVVPARERETNPVEVRERGVVGITPTYSPAVVAPIERGAAGPLEPFDLVVKAGGEPIAHSGDLERALDRAGCSPIDLEVLREHPVPLPGAALSTYDSVSLRSVPTCVDGRRRSIAIADPGVSTFIAAVTAGGPADKAGLRRGDALESINGRPVRSFRDLNALALEFAPGKPLDVALTDGRHVTFTPGEEMAVDEMTREKRPRLFLGFAPDQRVLVSQTALIAEQVPLHVGVVEAVTSSTTHLVDVVRMTVKGIALIATGEISFKTVGGPIMLFSIAAQAAEEGFESFLFKMALLSVNLGLMNLLPIPVLDGGHLAACLVEWVTRRPLSVRTREVANLVGIALLLMLMLVVFKNDIARLVG